VSGDRPESDIELVRWALGDIDDGATIDMQARFREPFLVERLGRVLAPDASIEFQTPDGGFMGGMAGPFRGLEGLQTAWAEWTEAWESWTFQPTEWIDVGDGRVLLLGDSLGRLSAAGAEVETHAAAMYEVRDGMIVRIQHFLDQDQARRAAGLA
jgi:ketosteroid isomerase-like protein